MTCITTLVDYEHIFCYQWWKLKIKCVFVIKEWKTHLQIELKFMGLFLKISKILISNFMWKNPKILYLQISLSKNTPHKPYESFN